MFISLINLDVHAAKVIAPKQKALVKQKSIVKVNIIDINLTFFFFVYAKPGYPIEIVCIHQSQY